MYFSFNYWLSEEIFDEIINEIQFKYLRALVHPGEMVGPLAAQSIGEPTTQLTLNTFHSAGTAKANATQGVPRIQELLSVSRNPKNPSNSIYLKDSSQSSALSVKKDIQKTTLNDITKSVRIYYDPNPLSSNTSVQEDRELLQLYEKFSITQSQACVSPWIMRLELDEDEMVIRNVNDMTLIQSKIENNKVLKVFDCIHTDINSNILCISEKIHNSNIEINDQKTLIRDEYKNKVFIPTEPNNTNFDLHKNKKLSLDNNYNGTTQLEIHSLLQNLESDDQIDLDEQIELDSSSLASD